MAQQDLTPQLRTRLSRMERAVGWFVLLATLLMLFGFGYYLHNTATRKGWFKKRVPYYTYVDSASGLTEGDPVLLMGSQAGHITDVWPMPPEDWEHNIYVEFEITEPHYGYLWTRGSVAKVTSGLLSKRALEITKGTNGYATYLFFPLKEVSLAEAESLPDPEKWLIASEYYDSTGTNLVLKAKIPLTKEVLSELHRLGVTRLGVLDSHEERKKPTVVWHDQNGGYVKFIPKDDAKADVKANLYWLVADESPAVSDRLEKLAGQVEAALPSVFDITNKINAVLANSASLTSNLNVVAYGLQPATSNLNQITSLLRGPGSLGEWMLGTNGYQQMVSTLANANTLTDSADTNMVALFENIGRTLNNLADITSNLNAQVQANTNMLGSISKSVVDADDLVQGLKRHWLLRSAFKATPAKSPAKPPANPKTNAPAVANPSRLSSPREAEKR